MPANDKELGGTTAVADTFEEQPSRPVESREDQERDEQRQDRMSGIRAAIAGLGPEFSGFNKEEEAKLGGMSEAFDELARYLDLEAECKKSTKKAVEALTKSKAGISKDQLVTLVAGQKKLFGEILDKEKKAFQERIGLTEQQILEKMNKLETDRNASIFEYFQAINPDLEVVDIDRGVYKLKGADIYGSLYSLVDTNLSVDNIRALSKKIGLVSDDKVKARVVLSGSGTQKEINLFPADADMAEHVVIIAESKQEAALLLLPKLEENLARLGSDHELEFIEMKLGVYPAGAQEEAGKSLKWTSKTIQRDTDGMFQIIPMADGSTRKITLKDAVLDPGMIKIDWRGYADNKEITEITKVINTTVRSASGVEISGHPMKDVLYQEVYYDNPSVIGLLEHSRDPKVLYTYRAFLKKDMMKYGKEGKFTKVAKRMWNLLKVEGNLSLAVELSDVLQSQFARLTQIEDRIGMLADALKNGTKLSRENMLSQIDRAMTFLDGSDQISERDKYRNILKGVKEDLAKLEPKDGKLKSQDIADRIGSMRDDMQESISNGMDGLFMKNVKLMDKLNEVNGLKEPVEFTTKNGEPKRISIESSVDSGSIAGLKDLQQKLTVAIPDLKPVAPEKFHFTLNHFGKPQDIFAELQKLVPDIEMFKLLEAMSVLVRQSHDIVEKTMTLKSEKIVQLDMGAIALKFDKAPFENILKKLDQQVDYFLRVLGVKDPEAFRKGSENFKFGLPDIWTPHMTLGYIAAEKTVDPSLLNIDVTKTAVKISPSEAENVTL
jgi:hypothetical protein